MSSFYEMSVEVSGYDPAKVAEIQAAAEQEWPFDDWWRAGDENDSAATMHASGQNSLCGGESEEEFTERLSLAIWRPTAGIATFLLTPLTWRISPSKRTNWTKQIARLIQDDHNSSTGDAQT